MLLDNGKGDFWKGEESRKCQEISTLGIALAALLLQMLTYFAGLAFMLVMTMAAPKPAGPCDSDGASGTSAHSY